MEEISTEVITEKKKRGRPKKIRPCSEFPEYHINIFSNYVDTYNNIIKMFIDTDDHISKDTWNTIYEHIKLICNILKEENNFWFNIDDYSYKPNSLIKDIDLYRERFRKQCIKRLYESEETKLGYRGFMIFSHLKVYIIESRK